MFLAWNEIKRNILRFTLIVGVLMLVSYLVFFLSGLANGLQNMNKSAIDVWEADGIIVTGESDKSLPQSHFDEDVFSLANKNTETANLGFLSAIATVGENSRNVAIFGVEADEFLMPEIEDGKSFAKKNEAIASRALEDDGFKIGDTIQLSASDKTLTITGFTDDYKFSAAPVIYTDFDSYREIKFGEINETNEKAVSGIVVRTDHLDQVEATEKLETIEMDVFIKNLPGFKEQNLTLNLMISFLFVISAFILAIFLYVLTIQKSEMFGILKAEGISNAYLVRSVLAQTFILSFVGVAIGLGFTLLTGLFLPAAVPVAFSFMEMLWFGVIFIIISMIGALFSVRTIIKIDPLKAIGGS